MMFPNGAIDKFIMRSIPQSEYLHNVILSTEHKVKDVGGWNYWWGVLYIIKYVSYLSLLVVIFILLSYYIYGYYYVITRYVKPVLQKMVKQE